VGADSARVLFVEDDTSLREGIASVLAAHDYEVHPLSEGLEIDRVMRSVSPDLVLLDIALRTGPDGFELARTIRQTSDVPLMFLTAADTAEDRIRGFEFGADDYLVKPFAIAELLARIRALLRRSGRTSSGTIRVGDLVVDVAARRVERAGVAIALTPTEFDLIATLVRAPRRTWSKRDLLASVWGFSDYQPHLVEVHMSSLRRKLEATGPRLVQTERNGYVVRA
jgi:two-component system, OmpR family, response regulator